MEDRLPRPTHRDHRAALALIVPLALLVHLPRLLFARVQRNLDFNAHYRWAIETAAAMAAGDPWPRWMAAANGGLGEPALLYYAPLYYLTTGTIRFATGNTWTAMQVVETASTFLVGWFTWRLVRAWTTTPWALLAAALAVLNPMIPLLRYGFNGLPWATAFAPLTILLWALLRPGADARILNPAAILALGLTILTHTVSGLMATIVVAALAARSLSRTTGRWRLDPRPALAAATTILGGLLLAAAYLLPAIAAQPLIHDEIWRTGITTLNAFALPTVTRWLFGVRWFAFQYPLAITLILAFLLAALPLRRAPPALKAGLLWPGLLLGGTALILATELSYPLWRLDTPLRTVQFPHRFLAITSILVPVLGATALARTWRRTRTATLLAAALAANAALTLLVVAKTGMIDGKPIATSPDQLTPYIGLEEYRLRSAGPNWTAYNKRGGFAAECAQAHIQCSPMTRHGRAMTWHIDAPAPTTLVLPAFAFPALDPTIDGHPTPQQTDPDTGLIRIDLPLGPSTVAIAWHMLPTETIGLALTTLTTLALLALHTARRRPAAHKPPTPDPPSST